MVLGVAIMQSATSSTVLADNKQDARITWQSGSSSPSDCPFGNVAGDALIVKTQNGCIQFAWKNANAFDGIYISVYWANINKWSVWKKIAVTNV